MGIKESLGKGFKITGQSMSLVLVLFVFGAVWNILNVFLTPKGDNVQLATSVSLVVVAVLFGLVSIYLQAGSLGFILNAIKTGRADMAAFKDAGGKFYVRLLLLGLLVAVIAGILILIAALIIAATSGNVVAVIAAVALATTGIFFAILIFLAPYIIVAEDKGVLASVKQSMASVKQNLLKVVGLALLLILIGFGAGLVLGVVLAGVSAAIKGDTAQVLFAILSSFVNSYLGVLVSASFMAFYLGISGGSAPSTGGRSLSDLVK